MFSLRSNACLAALGSSLALPPGFASLARLACYLLRSAGGDSACAVLERSDGLGAEAWSLRSLLARCLRGWLSAAYDA